MGSGHTCERNPTGGRRPSLALRRGRRATRRAVLGGVLPSLALAQTGRAQGLESWVTHAMASPVDYAGALHCAAALGGGPHGLLMAGAPFGAGGQMTVPPTLGHGGRP